MYQLCPSILSADFNRLGEQIKILEEEGIEWLHIDVMDGDFVPSISFGMPVIKSIRKESKLFFDVHLMVTEPERYIRDFVDCGADSITVHAEACEDLERTIEQIREAGVKVGVSIKPATPVNDISHMLEDVDMVLVMTVQPGFGGQKYLEECTEKIQELRDLIRDEDLNVDIQVDGGINDETMETVLKAGARLAEPGEFTKRAFLNGRIDLSQAEAVIDVINAKNEYALKSSVGQLRGSVSKKIRELREKILYEIAFIESALDDPEHISLDGYGERLLIGVQKMEPELSRLIRSSANGRVVSEGIRTVILGKPNAGKSSLMNVLVGEDRAIVTDIAGTTRDILEEHIYLQGISLNVVDTAGIRSTSDVVEKIGVERAMEAARDADLIIYVVDGSRELDENDLQIMELIRERKAVVLLNKSDLEPVVSLEEIAEKSGHRVISISAKEETGIDQLEEEIKSLFYEGEIDFNDQILITNVRHAEALREAYDSIRMVENSIESGMPEDFFSIDLMNAYEKLGLIVGEAVEDDLVNEIFSKFCMGK